jgi:hypothetical protein
VTGRGLGLGARDSGLGTRECTYGAIEDEAGQDEDRTLPLVGLEEYAGEGCEHEGAEARAADCDARGQGPLGLEVVADADDGRQVDEPEADSWWEKDKKLSRRGSRIVGGAADGPGLTAQAGRVGIRDTDRPGRRMSS